MAFFVIILTTFVYFFDIFAFNIFAYIWKVTLEVLCAQVSAVRRVYAVYKFWL